MENRFRHHGMISWQELSTDDPDRSRKFYGDLFGWEYKEFPMEEGESYWVVKVDGEEIAGIMKMPPAAGAMPSYWGIYITVDDVDKTVEKAAKLGAQVLVPPTDIPQVGRFATLQEAGGAAFSVIKYMEM
ncbi:MAG TPA: VOC family protein [Syntrophorhabdaceae bacterium]|nr:VOC family protein [Syntrophorhabdaceae bacterium]